MLHIRILIFSIGALAMLMLVISWVWSMQAGSGQGGSLSAPVEETFLVRYDGLSFQPPEIKVSEGTKVFFANESKEQRPMYVASDDHPSHKRYPGFDTANVNQKFPALGESFDFVFDKAGMWPYHDHNFPSARGTIIVE